MIVVQNACLFDMITCTLYLSWLDYVHKQIFQEENIGSRLSSVLETPPSSCGAAVAGSGLLRGLSTNFVGPSFKFLHLDDDNLFFYLPQSKYGSYFLELLLPLVFALSASNTYVLNPHIKSLLLKYLVCFVFSDYAVVVNWSSVCGIHIFFQYNQIAFCLSYIL